MKKELKKTKKIAGITLIALVITIVVLIILAGVLINISLGNNGLFNKAKTAREMYTNSQNYEETEIAKITNNIDGYVDGNRGTIKISEEEYEMLKNANSYPTEEKIVGTWIDGITPIYKKTIQITTPNSTGDYKIIEYNTISQNLNFIIKADGVILDSNGGTNIPSFYDSNTWTELTWDVSTRAIYMRATNTVIYAGRTAYITIQYTKTTD